MGESSDEDFFEAPISLQAVTYDRVNLTNETFLMLPLQKQLNS